MEDSQMASTYEEDRAQHRTDVLSQIEQLQAIQKTHPPISSAWMQASEMLEPLFAEMAWIERNEPYQE
jgi:hypothetical protein